ncbi:MAG TPA: hypothetical protein VFU17_15635 [Candidatus Limnocylindrales bacterium]|nr:hypothetical protein [Candidatus Limnocylindrales bacterium]
MADGAPSPALAMLTPTFLLIAVVRVLGSLPVLRWPFAGGILAVLVDLLDLILLDWLDPLAFVHYQAFDKYLDQVYMLTFLVVALRWQGIERNVAVALYLFRLVGFIAFELTGARISLVLFPNVFEIWFLVVAGLHAIGRNVAWKAPQLVAVLAVALLAKEVQEWAIHGARLFDNMSSLKVLDDAFGWLTGR